MTYDIVTLGDYFFDQIFTGLPGFPVLGQETICEDITSTGGALFITVVSLHRLGVRAGWIGHFGNDFYSRFVYDLAEQEGVDLSLTKRLDQPHRRVTTSLPFHDERAFVTYMDPDVDDQQTYWLSALQSTDFRHLHMGHITPLNEIRPFVEFARSRGATVSLDSQDVAMLERPHECRQVLPLVDIFMPNAREALIITETNDIDSALQQLMQLCKVVVIKNGADGAWVGSDGKITHVAGINAGPSIDTTGAGDCFNAGFLFGYVVDGVLPDRCAQYGNICGGLSVTGVGGATTAPTYEELMSWAAKIIPT